MGVKDMDLKQENRVAVRKAFAATKCPLGNYWAGELTCHWKSRKAFEYFRKSYEGGYSWSHVWFVDYIEEGLFVEKDYKVYVKLLHESASQHNPEALYWLGDWYRNWDGTEKYEKARSYILQAAELGWKDAMDWLADGSYLGRGGEKDLIQSVRWSWAGSAYAFWTILSDASQAWRHGMIGELGCDFSLLAMELGKGLFWYGWGSFGWEGLEDEDMEFGELCLDYYCEMTELQQDAIFLFLQFWNGMTRVKGPGVAIAKMAWEARNNHMPKKFQGEEKKLQVKRLKKAKNYN